jgi:hypothetical protein
VSQNCRPSPSSSVWAEPGNRSRLSGLVSSSPSWSSAPRPAGDGATVALTTPSASLSGVAQPPRRLADAVVAILASGPPSPATPGFIGVDGVIAGVGALCPSQRRRCCWRGSRWRGLGGTVIGGAAHAAPSASPAALALVVTTAVSWVGQPRCRRPSSPPPRRCDAGAAEHDSVPGR